MWEKFVAGSGPICSKFDRLNFSQYREGFGTSPKTLTMWKQG